MTTFFPRGPGRRRAFTLVEMLVVMGVISILLVAVAPLAFHRSTANDLTRASYQMAGAIDRARADAMARKVYRYVAVEKDTVGGVSVVRVKLLGYPTGESISSGSAGKLSLLDPIITLNNLQLALFPTDSPVRPLADQNLADLPESFRITTGGVVDRAYLFEISANGQAQLLESQSGANGANGTAAYTRSLSHWIEIGLQPTHGQTVSAPMSTGDRAIVQVTGLTGQTQIYRP